MLRALYKALDQYTGTSVAQPFSPVVTGKLCGSSGLGSCGAALDAALRATYQALVKANGGTKNVALWTRDANTVAAGLIADGILGLAAHITGTPGAGAS